MSDAPIPVAFFAYPNAYGLYTVFRNLRAGLLPMGYDLRWVGYGPAAQQAFDDPTFASERACGTVVGPALTDEREIARALAGHLAEIGYRYVIFNPPQETVQMNLVRYLPAELKRIFVVHSSARGAHLLLRDLRQHVHATVGVAPRSRDDLINHHGFDRRYTVAIPNALDLSAYRNLKPRDAAAALRVLSFGRIEEITKGVFWLPRILKHCPAEVGLTIAGDGPHLAELRRRCEPLGQRVRILGLVPPARIPELISQHDVFIMTSRTEGLPYTLIEAMAGGCVPVSSIIRGVTDFVVQHERTGLLYPIGDVQAAADAITRLHRDRTLLARMAGEAGLDVKQRFSAEVMARQYVDLFNRIDASPRPLGPILSLDRWELPASFSPGLSRFIPRGVKNLIRRLTAG